MKYVCRYAIVRFMPYAVTGEFANIGVVVMCPAARYFGYKVIERVARITSFFDELDANIFRKARKAYTDELMRIGQMVERTFWENSHGSDASFADSVFNELVRPREALMYCADERVVLADDPAEKMAELFDHYVGRAFATKAYQERDVEKRVHRILRVAELTDLYQEHTLGRADAYKARMPFARLDEQGRALRAIKPLFLAHEDATRLYDHGWEWLGKVRKLRSDKVLVGDVLFAVKSPQENFGPRANAYCELVEQIRSEDIKVVDENDDGKIVQFAKTEEQFG
ncbi:DUF3037 domain-containing protein [Paraburkholderia bryophila]|uniref:DUF3037 family protein n=1 Tax=Paraburkholderia bryophila TaxID=420952 RepID=A0A7Y9WES1_9BURK|nr:DUF3037 domain-containing protein [Paraburkholderia bryophila]NYH18931.1 hypothetical protein [Paraburkholderia bryophila]